MDTNIGFVTIVLHTKYDKDRDGNGVKSSEPDSCRESVSECSRCRGNATQTLQYVFGTNIGFVTTHFYVKYARTGTGLFWRFLLTEICKLVATVVRLILLGLWPGFRLGISTLSRIYKVNLFEMESQTLGCRLGPIWVNGYWIATDSRVMDFH